MAGDAPVLSNAVERRDAIVENRPGRWHVENNALAPPYSAPYELPIFSQVLTYASEIEEAAHRHGIDPDLLRAIVYLETSRGYYDGILDWYSFVTFGLISPPNSLRPSNVNIAFWPVSREEMSVPLLNLDYSARLISELSDRIDNATPEKIATAYNALGAEVVSAYGASVGRLYTMKPWLEETGFLTRLWRSAWNTSVFSAATNLWAWDNLVLGRWGIANSDEDAEVAMIENEVANLVHQIEQLERLRTSHRDIFLDLVAKASDDGEPIGTQILRQFAESNTIPLNTLSPTDFQFLDSLRSAQIAHHQHQHNRFSRNLDQQLMQAERMRQALEVAQRQQQRSDWARQELSRNREQLGRAISHHQHMETWTRSNRPTHFDTYGGPGTVRFNDGSGRTEYIPPQDFGTREIQ